MSNPTSIYRKRFNVADPVHGDIACLELGCGDGPDRPICLFLYGGGGSAETLLAIEPLLASAWQAGTLPACRVATATVDPWGFYLDEAARGTAWESFIADRLTAALQRDHEAPIGLLGISMGGYGALKIVLSRPQKFAAVAALAPMLEPSLRADAVPLRNRYHYPAEVPAALLGPTRDADLYAADHPAGRARRNADALRQSGLGIYIDAGSADALHAHDGAEFLHRVLWALDIRHEYHLLADADHVGPSLLPRLQAALQWLGQRLAPNAIHLSPDEEIWQRYLDGETPIPPATPLAPTSPLMPRFLRHALRSLREIAAKQDDTFDRVYGRLPVLPD